MYRLNIKILILLTLTLLVYACKPISYVNIQVLQPAQVSLQSKPSKIVLAYRVHPLDSLVFGEYFNKEDINELEYILPEKHIDVLADMLIQSPKFDSTTFEITEILPKDFNSTYIQISSDTVNKLLKDFNSQCIISLEYYNIKSKLTFGYKPELYAYKAEKKYDATALWRVYDSVKDRVINEVLMKDSLIFTGVDILPAEAMYQIPYERQGLREMCSKMATKYAMYIAPYWQFQSRVFFCKGNLDMFIAQLHVENDQWEKASEIWKRYVNHTNRKKVARSLFNLALYEEVNDNLEKALELASQSGELLKNSYIDNYILLLKERIKVRSIIYNQIYPEIQ